MKILSPINLVSEALPLCEAGADEFYCGVADNSWLDKYTYMATTNSRNDPASQLASLRELKEIIDIAHAHSVKVFLTVNDVIYTKRQYPAIIELVHRAADLGTDGFIVADPALLVRLREVRFRADIQVSLRGTVFNSETVDFYRDLGCSRIHLPQDLTLKEIKEIIGNCGRGMQFGAFILNAKCANVCGFCTFHHGLENIKGTKGRTFDLVCYEKINISGFRLGSKNEPISPEICRRLIPKDRRYNYTHCGVCCLWDFYRMQVATVKIVGRGFPTHKKLKDVQFIRRSLDLLQESNITKSKFRDFVKRRYLGLYRGDCRLYCYYYSDCHNKSAKYMS